ncbi:MAG: hypothetical protein J5379_03175 [Clostridiales bacterium]|nr:hypothetical protein [Clostridiales bacterium]
MAAKLRNEYLEYLFSKHILVHEEGEGQKPVDDPSYSSLIPERISHSNQYAAETLLSLARLLNIRITSGGELAQPEMIPFSAEMIGENVPMAFYQGFPKSVKKLSFQDLLYDQVLSYFVTYGLGDFSAPQYSVFEKKEELERSVFKEEGTVKDFVILPQDEAEKTLQKYIADMLSSTRPLNDRNMKVAALWYQDHGTLPSNIASKTTAVRLLLETRDTACAKTLMLSDVIKIMEEANFRLRANEIGSADRFSTCKVNFPNQTRKLITKVMDEIFESNRVDMAACYEKKKTWAGLLHHIHYQAKTTKAQGFLDAMRGKKNYSVYSMFEKILAEDGPADAAYFLKQSKGSGALLRHLNYLASRCESEEELSKLIRILREEKDHKPVILMQMLLMYAGYERTFTIGRTFQFTKFNQLRVHEETEEEEKKRRSKLLPRQRELLLDAVRQCLKETLFGRLGKVYIHPDMERYAVPINESASQGGFGVLSSGSWCAIPKAKKIRGFTYWEKVDDIDLSVIGLTPEGIQVEFSWRTMSGEQSEGITYSGDQTSGYNGGSEFFDIDVPQFRKEHPEVRYLIFCDNVFSYLTFAECVCRAGYMIRDNEDSGEIFEPKTVESSFTVNAPARFCYLFGIDLETNRFVWLNMAREGNTAVAGETPLRFLIEKFHITDSLNLRVLFEMLAEKVVEDRQEADVIVEPPSVTAGKRDDREVIHEYDFERIMALLEKH